MCLGEGAVYPCVYPDFPLVLYGVLGLPLHFAGGGFAVEQYDIRHHAEDDIISRMGFFRAVDCILRVRKFGFVMLAPPCSWFVFLSSPMHRPGSV
jgi:hypothetical protein